MPKPVPRILHGGGHRRFPLPLLVARNDSRAKPRPRPNAVHEMLTRDGDFHDLPFGGHAGEMLPAAPPPQPAPEPFVIEPPPWQAQLDSGDFDLADALAPPAPTNELSAVDEIRLAEDGYNPPEFVIPAPPPPPLERFVPPEPDWEEEERERAERERAETERIARERRAELLRELLAEDEETYPKGKS